MLEIPVLRWGKPYESFDQQEVVHFETGEPLAKVHQANAGLVKMDMRKAQRARDLLREIPCSKLLEICKNAANLYMTAELPLGNGKQTPEEFCRIQSASTGMPEWMCAGNMKKIAFVLENMESILDSLTRGLPLDILTRGYGKEERGVMMSYQANSPVLGLVLPSNSPGVHTLWMPILPMQVGLVLKPGSSEPWTPYRMTEAFYQAGIPRECISVYPGPHDVGSTVTELCQRVMLFGGQQTIDKYKGNPNVQAHGPGFSKILLGDDVVDRWEDYLDLMVDSIFQNGGRSCINASSVWASRHSEAIADAIAKRIGPAGPTSMTDPEAPLAAFTMTGAAKAMNGQIETGLSEPGVTEVTAKYRDGERLIELERCDYLRPTIVHCANTDATLANTEYMFPMASVVQCDQKEMLKKIGPTLVCTAITEDQQWSQQLLDATHIDRLNIGPIKTNALNWLQPHEGNIVEFLYRARAFQNEAPAAH
ncbi:aldehyde dehydrogenase family protein [Gimesia aquarii]|uniref:Succinate-semialdehyde dehydrogenase [NADP(+)] 2 n=1 Tax=Gimesia aquarii TaxID=2527964 RepID=A0A517VXG9_9PLAN|nr:aldehyde dehydrogenase family protein [Gimesia aquarii]QDT97700.1 Putative succinate-semialdehyde dehydrogenase [NADP(+)] 2 [Gimesia aquarii]